MATDPDDLERRARQLRSKAAEQRAQDQPSMFDPELMEGEEQRRVEQQIEEAQRREQLAERDRIRHIARLLADADDEQLRAALHDDDAFRRMTDAGTIESLFGGRLLDHSDARQRAREAIHRELVRRQGQSEAPGR